LMKIFQGPVRMLARFFPRSPLWPVFALCTLVLFLDLDLAPGQSTKQNKRQSVVIAPVWYTDPPSVQDTLIARGKGKSNDEQVAIDKAVFEARSSLAHTIDQRWERLLRTIQDEGGPDLTWTSEPVTLAAKGVQARQGVDRVCARCVARGISSSCPAAAASEGCTVVRKGPEYECCSRPRRFPSLR
jgi:hypothetical protein